MLSSAILCLANSRLLSSLVRNDTHTPIQLLCEPDVLRSFQHRL